MTSLICEYFPLDNNTLNHLENAGPWDEEDFEMVCLKRRITDVGHGLLYIYPNILLSGWEYLPEGIIHYMIPYILGQYCVILTYCSVLNSYRISLLTRKPLQLKLKITNEFMFTK